MQKINLSHAIDIGIDKINQSGTVFTPYTPSIFTDLASSNGVSGVMIIPTNEDGRDPRKYEVLKLAPPEVPDKLMTTVDDIWSCAKEHYGLTVSAAAAGIGGIPISKLRLGHHVLPGTSQYTNIVSHLGVKFFPMTTLPKGSIAAKVAKNTFGTIRVFGIIGRSLPYVAVGLAVVDAISIGMCVYEERNK